jgi:hypothetical protein
MLSFSTLAQTDTSPRTLSVSLEELKTALRKRPLANTLLEINSAGPTVQISEPRAIRNYRVTDVRNRVYLAQNLCHPELPVSFPDGTKGVIVCWLRSKNSSNRGHRPLPSTGLITY